MEWLCSSRGSRELALLFDAETQEVRLLRLPGVRGPMKRAGGQRHPVAPPASLQASLFLPSQRIQGNIHISGAAPVREAGNLKLRGARVTGESDLL